MREIKFRGCGIESREWIYGYLACDDQIMTWDKTNNGSGLMMQVLPETVGQCTGIRDKNDKEIYEGDIIKCEGSVDEDAIGKIIYRPPQFDIEWISGPAWITESYDDFSAGFYILEIIGNIHDNPELLEKV